MKYTLILTAGQALLAATLLCASANSQAAPGDDSCDQALIATQSQLDQASAAGDMPSPDRRNNLDALVNAAVAARRACTGVQSALDAPPAAAPASPDESPTGTMADKLFQSQPEPVSSSERRSRERARSPKAG